MQRKTKTGSFAFRVSPEVKEKFHRMSYKHGGPSEVLRILVVAFIENRLTIQPKEELK